MKTIYEWLQEIEDAEVRERAIENFRKQRPDSKGDQEPQLNQALLAAFYWAKAPEGYDYWNQIHENLLNQNR